MYMAGDVLEVLEAVRRDVGLRPLRHTLHSGRGVAPAASQPGEVSRQARASRVSKRETARRVSATPAQVWPVRAGGLLGRQPRAPTEQTRRPTAAGAAPVWLNQFCTIVSSSQL